MFFFFFSDSVLIWPNLKKFLSDDGVCFCCLALHTVLFKHLLLSFCPQIKNPLPTILFFLLHLPIILLSFFFFFLWESWIHSDWNWNTKREITKQEAPLDTFTLDEILLHHRWWDSLPDVTTSIMPSMLCKFTCNLVVVSFQVLKLPTPKIAHEINDTLTEVA